MKHILFITILFLMFVMLTNLVVAQVPPPLLPSGPSQTPIDGGLGILAAAGGAYALKKLRGRKKAEEESLKDLKL